MKNNCLLRVLREEDIPDILAIYEPFILETAATFEEVVPTFDDFKKRVEGVVKQNPYLVCEINGKVAGYAYASEYRSRVAYRWNREVSVYIHPDFHRRSIGRALLEALLPILKMQGYAKLYGVITLPNAGSIALHEKMGFKPMTVYPDVGYKLGAWHDVGWWALTFDANLQESPKEIVSFEEIQSSKEVDSILGKAQTFINL